MIDQFTRPKEFYIKRYNLNSLLNPLPMVATTRFQPYLHPEKSVLHSDMTCQICHIQLFSGVG